MVTKEETKEVLDRFLRKLNFKCYDESKSYCDKICKNCEYCGVSRDNVMDVIAKMIVK